MNKHDKDLQKANTEFCDIVGVCFVFLTSNGLTENLDLLIIEDSEK